MAREIITIECTEARKQGKTPSRYTTTRNKKTKTEKLELKKYNPFLRRHTLHREIQTNGTAVGRVTRRKIARRGRNRRLTSPLTRSISKTPICSGSM
jgi:large subunit ribosomal protein L33